MARGQRRPTKSKSSTNKPSSSATPQPAPRLARTLWPELSSSSALPSTRLEDFGGDLRAWNAAWEQELTDTYHDQTKPFITGVGLVETRVCSKHLDEHGHAVRAKGRTNVAMQGAILSDMAKESDFDEKYVRKWEEASVERREEMVLEALHRAAKEGREEIRILAPELVLKDLTEGDGSGLFHLFDKNLVPAGAEQFAIVSHPQMDRLYGFTRAADSDQLPLSRAVRAFMEEFLLLRHSLFLNVFSDVFDQLTGEKLTPRRRIGNTAREVSDPLNCVNVVASSEDPSDIFYTDLVPETCTVFLCSKTAAKDGGKLMYCSACQAVGRWVPYCSIECQKADRKLGYHKRTCGKRLSDVDPVPLYSASDLASSSSTVNRHLRRQLDALARNSDALWHTFNGHETISTMFGCGDGSGTPEGAEELKAHHLANRKLAVEQKDPLAIGIIALAATEGFKSTDLDLKWHRTEAEIAKSRREAARLLAVTKEQLRREFELTEDELEETMVLALRNMPEWGQEAHKATVDRVQSHARQQDSLDRGRYQDVYKLHNFEPDTAEPLKALCIGVTNAMLSANAMNPNADEETKHRAWRKVFEASDMFMNGTLSSRSRID